MFSMGEEKKELGVAVREKSQQSHSYIVYNNFELIERGFK